MLNDDEYSSSTDRSCAGNRGYGGEYAVYIQLLATRVLSQRSQPVQLARLFGKRRGVAVRVHSGKSPHWGGGPLGPFFFLVGNKKEGL